MVNPKNLYSDEDVANFDMDVQVYSVGGPHTVSRPEMDFLAELTTDAIDVIVEKAFDPENPQLEVTPGALLGYKRN